MIETLKQGLRKQIADNGWLYQDDPQGTRTFAKEVFLGVSADEWAECTDEEKAAWEQEHTPENEEPQPNDYDAADGQIEDV